MNEGESGHYDDSTVMREQGTGRRFFG